ncbi:MAG: DUF2294 domain-containing protein [Thermacetogeniaceae bacterium]
MAIAKLNDKEIKELQHELKIYISKYFKRILGRGVDYTKINVFEDMLVIRGEGYLTEPEKFIVQTPNGAETIRASRTKVVNQHIEDNTPFIEERVRARAIHHSFCIEPENNFWMHCIVFDHPLTE